METNLLEVKTEACDPPHTVGLQLPSILSLGQAGQSRQELKLQQYLECSKLPSPAVITMCQLWFVLLYMEGQLPLLPSWAQGPVVISFQPGRCGAMTSAYCCWLLDQWVVREWCQWWEEALRGDIQELKTSVWEGHQPWNCTGKWLFATTNKLDHLSRPSWGCEWIKALTAKIP